MLAGSTSQPVTGGVRPHIVLSNRKRRVISQSVDFPNIPGEGYRQSHCGLVSFAALSSFFVAGFWSIVDRLLGGHLMSKASLISTVPPLIKSRARCWKLSLPFEERSTSSGSRETAICKEGKTKAVSVTDPSLPHDCQPNCEKDQRSERLISQKPDIANIKRPCLNRMDGWFKRRGSKRIAFINTYTFSFHVMWVWCCWQGMLNNLELFFVSLYKRRNSLKIPEILWS